MHNVWIDRNMQMVYIYCGFSKPDMVQLARNAVDMCQAEEDLKNAIYKELDEVDTSD